jgi:threonine dehydratase
MLPPMTSDAARPSRRLSLARIREAAGAIDPVFRNSPEVVIDPLSEKLGCSLTLKVEITNLLRCFKGRGADFYVARLADKRPLVSASAGNFGLALAYVCRKREVRLTIFAACTASPFKVERMRALCSDVRLAGDDFDAAKIAAREMAAESGALWVEDGAVPEISEGAGSIAVELMASGSAFDDLLVPLGNGALLNGVACWVKAVSPATRVIGVQSRGAPAMAESFHTGRPVSPAQVHTIADGLAVRAPVPEALEDMRGVVDDVLLVDDTSLIEAMKLLHRHAGLVVEPSGAAGIAALLEGPDVFAGRRVATVLSGGNLAPAQAREWLGREVKT